LIPVEGDVITELEAVSILTGSIAELFAAGGVCGAQGSIWLSVRGNKEEIRKIEEIYSSILLEPPFGENIKISI
jgi:hypothetical protein